MKTNVIWWLITPGFFFALYSMYCSAEIKNVTLNLTFDKYFTPHTTFIVNGIPVYAMVDTGSSFGFHLQETQLKKLKGLRRERTYLSTDGKGKIQENTEYLAKSLNVNGFHLSDVTVTPFKQWGMKISGDGELPVGPVAGLGVFKDKQILLDYRASALTISDDFGMKKLKKNGFREIPFHMSSDGMVFDVEQSGNRYHLVLDTGATVSVIWGERLRSYKPVSCLVVDPEMDNKECEATVVTVGTSDGNSEQFGAVVVSGDFKHMGKVDGLLGNNFLRDNKLLIDFQKNKAYISHVNPKK